MTVPNRTDGVLTEVEMERTRQDNLFGEQNHSPLVWQPILLEEIGEVAEALNRWCHGTPAFGSDEDYRKELIQVAAVAVAAVEAFDRNRLGC